MPRAPCYSPTSSAMPAPTRFQLTKRLAHPCLAPSLQWLCFQLCKPLPCRLESSTNSLPFQLRPAQLHAPESTHSRSPPQLLLCPSTCSRILDQWTSIMPSGPWLLQLTCHVRNSSTRPANELSDQQTSLLYAGLDAPRPALAAHVGCQSTHSHACPCCSPIQPSFLAYVWTFLHSTGWP